MDVGIGLPATVPGVEGRDLIESARRAEAAGFSSLGTIDRLVYPNFEPLVALAAAAAVTERIRVATTVLLAPQRVNTPLLAKQAATVDRISGGRLVLGMAPGGRDDDFEAAGASAKERGRVFDEQLDELKRIWSGEERGLAGPIGPPALNGGPTVIIGGSVEASYRRAARYGAGWIMGGGTPEMFADGLGKVRAAWKQAGREDEPRTLALTYVALGPNAAADADAYLHHYYAWLGPVADMIAASAATDEEAVRQRIAAFAEVGCGELILFPCSRDPEQVDRIAAAAL